MTVAKESTKWKQVRCGTLAAAMVLLVSVALAQATSAPRARIGANTTASGNPMSYSLYTPELNLMSQTTPSTASNPPIANEYIWFGGQPVAQIDVASNATRSTFTDHLGTPILQTDATGTVIWRAEYDPYGEARQMRVGTSTDQPLRLPGQEAAMTSGGNEENYNIFRWYRSGWGRYTQPDSVDLAYGVNLYAYVKGNPLSTFDPFGLWKTGGRNSKDNTAVCRGGKAVPQVVDDGPPDVKKCTGECLGLEHELSHVADINRVSPDVCKGKPDGLGVIADTPKQDFESEVRAWTTSINCLLDRKASDLGGDCSCQRLIDFYLDWALEKRQIYRLMSRAAK